MDSREEKDLKWLIEFKKKTLMIIVAVLAVGILITMFAISTTIKTQLMNDNLSLTHKLSALIRSSMKHLMITGDPGLIQKTLEEVGRSNHMISSVFVLDINGKIMYSSNERDVGKVLDRSNESSCIVCHGTKNTPPQRKNAVVHIGDESVQRVVSIIQNEEPCFRCHPREQEIIGKLVIDRSMQPTYSLITSVNAIMFVGGIMCLLFLIPISSKIISRGLNRYISEIMRHNNELEILYLVVERLSKTLDIKELRQVVIDIIRNTINATSLIVITPREGKEFSALQWFEGENATSRKKIDQDHEAYSHIQAWLDGSMKEPALFEDKNIVYIPVTKRGNPLALIIARYGGKLFQHFGLNLIRTVSDHIAIAFENARLYQIAITDELTQLYTQRFFRTSIEKQFLQYEAYGEKFALLMIDIDDFKRINDSYGHMTGDAVLKHFSQVLVNAVRDNDQAFRYGGEEFTIILPSTDRSGALLVAERIRRDVESFRLEEEDLTLQITVSIGVSLCPDNAVTAKDLILKADRSLYAAKQSGKNRVVLSD